MKNYLRQLKPQLKSMDLSYYIITLSIVLIAFTLYIFCKSEFKLWPTILLIILNTIASLVVWEGGKDDQTFAFLMNTRTKRILMILPPVMMSLLFSGVIIYICIELFLILIDFILYFVTE